MRDRLTYRSERRRMLRKANKERPPGGERLDWEQFNRIVMAEARYYGSMKSRKERDMASKMRYVDAFRSEGGFAAEVLKTGK